jgi:hypothetical protein
MDDAGIDHIGLPAEGNRPAVDLELRPYYRAHIAANWPEEKREAAFQALRDAGHGDLIQYEISVRLSREEHQLAYSIIEALRDQFQIHPEIKESVHWKTLTAWLQSQFEDHKPLPPLEVIGADIGRVAKFKERSERL